MNGFDSLLTALTALRANVLRSVLTTLGIIIGVAAVIVMISVGSGAEQMMAGVITNLGSNLIIVMPGTTTSGGVRMGAGTENTLTDDDARALQAEIPSLLAAAPTVRGLAQVVSGNQNWSTVLYGSTSDYLVAREWNLGWGRLFRPDEMESAAKVALIGSTVANNVFPGQDPVGRYIRVNRVPLNVIGVLEPKGQTPQGQDQDDMVLVPLDTARKRILGDAALSGQSVGNILLKVRSSEEVGQAEEDARRVLKVRHRWRPGQDEDFTIRNLSQFLEARAQAVRIMSLLLMAVASISLVVGGIGIMNIMLVSVTERTREIGLRMALGARGRDILAQFLIEAVTLSLIGGAIGITLGILGSFLVARLASFPAVLGIKSMFLAFGFSAAVGVFFGYYPAHKASRLNPIEALRYE